MKRTDIADAHCVLEWHYNRGGILLERPSNARRNESTGVQLERIGHKPSMGLSFDALEDDGKEVYMTNVLNWKLPRDEELNHHIKEFFAEDWLREKHAKVAVELLGPQDLKARAAGVIAKTSKIWVEA